jgi:hypothetical protein
MGPGEDVVGGKSIGRGDSGLDAESVFTSVAVSATGWVGLATLRYAI